jgi:uncharacterized membrane protein YkoI
MSHRRSARSTVTTALVAGPLALALVACGNDDGGTGATDDTVGTSATVATPPPAATQPPPASSEGRSTRAPASDDGTAPRVATSPGTVLAAARTALAEVGGATLFSIDGEPAGWDVTLVAADGSESDVDVSVDGRSVTRGPVADVDDDPSDEAEDVAERRRLLADVRVDHTAAIETAAAEVPGGTVTGADLDLDDGVATWDVQLDEDTATEQTVTIDAITGDVLRVELDD